MRRQLLCAVLLPLHDEPLERVLRRGKGARDAHVLARLVSRERVPAPLCLQEIPLPLRPMHLEVLPARRIELVVCGLLQDGVIRSRLTIIVHQDIADLGGRHRVVSGQLQQVGQALVVEARGEPGGGR